MQINYTSLSSGGTSGAHTIVWKRWSVLLHEFASIGILCVYVSWLIKNLFLCAYVEDLRGVSLCI